MLNFVALRNRVAEHYFIFVASSALNLLNHFRLRHLHDEYVEKEVPINLSILTLDSCSELNCPICKGYHIMRAHIRPSKLR